MRTIIVNNKKYKWKCGKQVVVIFDQDQKKYTIHAYIVKNTSPYNFERGQFKRTSDGSITPKDISNYIQEHNL